MSEQSHRPPSFGQALGEAAQKIGKLHRRALAEFGSDFPSWMLLVALRDEGAALPVSTVVARLEQRMDLAESAVTNLLERAAEDGFVRYQLDAAGSTAELTNQGEQHLTQMYAHAREATDAAYAGVDPDSVRVATEVLLAVERQAAVLLGSAQARQ
ncbi:MarR family winged helix-turn-helix transcriptional regulator [Nocardia wallacei]|uniref:MarR family winged helix-turn-helix transcriptional regulator n=1 Tax=Nocardia wallacei TaxID=480035 RepID=UPI0024554703|nr:hypothetical protein [Nocardia wallacei]